LGGRAYFGKNISEDFMQFNNYFRIYDYWVVEINI
jgi:hypothetical protein